VARVWKPVEAPIGRELTPEAAAVVARRTLVQDPPLTLRWSASDATPLGSEAAHATRTGTLVELRTVFEINVVLGAVSVGGMPSATTSVNLVVRVIPFDAPVIVNG
jgi:hypothetical protein